MQFTITPDLFEQYPDTILGLVIARNIDNSGENAEIRAALQAAETSVAAKIGDTPLIDHPHVAPWREAYRQFGAKPKKYPSSIENMIRRNLKGHTLSSINPLVDLYNTISLRYLLPVGGEDLDKMTGDVLLTVAGEDETPVRLLGESEARPPYPGEVIYRDTVGTICRRWNWKEADRTKLTAETRRAVLVIEGLPPIERDVIEQAAADLAATIKRYCGGTVTSAMLDRDQPEVSLD